MAKFIMELPNAEIKKFAELGAGAEKMLGEMTEAGAKVAYKRAKANLRRAFKDSSRIEKNLVVTRTYKTPTDGAVNTKVGVYGYFIDKDGIKKPAPLVVQAREYGTSDRETKKGKKRGHIEKTPIIRTAFKKAEITQAMLEVQRKYIKDE